MKMSICPEISTLSCFCHTNKYSLGQRVSDEYCWDISTELWGFNTFLWFIIIYCLAEWFSGNLFTGLWSAGEQKRTGQGSRHSQDQDKHRTTHRIIQIFNFSSSLSLCGAFMYITKLSEFHVLNFNKCFMEYVNT